MLVMWSKIHGHMCIHLTLYFKGSTVYHAFIWGGDEVSIGSAALKHSLDALILRGVMCLLDLML